MTLTSAESLDSTAALEPAAPDIEPTQRLGDLLQGTAAGQQDSFAALYDVTAARVFGLTCAVLRNASLGEEVTQDVFLEIWQYARRFDRTKGTALSWIMTLSHSRAVEKVRHHQAVYLRDHRHAVTSYRPDVDVVLHGILAAQERSELHAALQTVTPRHARPSPSPSSPGTATPRPAPYWACP